MGVFTAAVKDGAVSFAVTVQHLVRMSRHGRLRRDYLACLGWPAPIPFHKWHLRALESCEIKPTGIVELARTATRSPTGPNVQAFCDAVLECDFWPTDRPGWGDLFIRDTEWSWRTGLRRLEDG